jgi:ubiquinone/menaquinone biosynthesis C-methylase UbiE
MDDRQVGRLWDENAEVWTCLARQGYDVYRDLVNTPAFLRMLPDVNGLRGLDVGCGEGHNTRLVAGRGARMTAIDISATFLGYAREMEKREPLGIHYQVASGSELPFAAASFDFVMATMSLMDMPHQDRAIGEAFRVLKPGGFLQFSISHPCFVTQRWQRVLDELGNRYGVICGDYFGQGQGQIEEWIFSAAPPEVKEGLRKFRIPRFPRTLSSWMNLLIGTGFVLEAFDEPYADEEIARLHPEVADTRAVASFLHVRSRKPASGA